MLQLKKITKYVLTQIHVGLLVICSIKLLLGDNIKTFQVIEMVKLLLVKCANFYLL